MILSALPWCRPTIVLASSTPREVFLLQDSSVACAVTFTQRRNTQSQEHPSP